MERQQHTAWSEDNGDIGAKTTTTDGNNNDMAKTTKRRRQQTTGDNKATWNDNKSDDMERKTTNDIMRHGTAMDNNIGTWNMERQQQATTWSGQQTATWSTTTNPHGTKTTKMELKTTNDMDKAHGTTNGNEDNNPRRHGTTKRQHRQRPHDNMRQQKDNNKRHGAKTTRQRQHGTNNK
ncbi:hypothetical protein JOB18_009993 [Solea senegalensis]|uniref:Uncharacterized protein n=1 Tax=Solea senegalensis TaxID=28829 RepID=A0AAV6R6N9_SOLSE|nr:hypothetical protein JOB18_009993 [Solea senegalensis]